MTGIGLGEEIEGGLLAGELIEALLEDGFHSPIAGIGEGQGTTAGRLKAILAEALSQSNDALCGPEVVENAVGEEGIYDAFAVRSDIFGFSQAPLGVCHCVGQSFRGHVFGDGGTFPGFSKPWVDRDKFEVVVDLDDFLGGPQPQPSFDPTVRGGV